MISLDSLSPEAADEGDQSSSQTFDILEGIMQKISAALY